MHRISFLRLAAVLSVITLAAACDTLTSAVDTRVVTRPAYTIPVATITVGNSGGNPLVSWGALTDATSYTVRLITYHTLNGVYQGRGFTTLTTTTGTSYLDTNNTYTGVYQCTNAGEDPWGNVIGFWYEYEVVSTFPTGTTSARHYAPITTEYC
jgi:hypothetical protein